MVQIMQEDSVKVESDGKIATLTINRPHSLNALNPDVLQGLILATQKLEKEGSVRAMIITGAGDKSFVAGADISSMSGLGPRAIADYVELGQRATRLIERSPIISVGAINGFALGGGMELALACDMLVCSEVAKLGQPEVNLGIIPGFGGTQRLTLRCGVGTARRLVLTGEIIDAAEALRLGLVDKVVPAEELNTAARKWCELILKKAPLAVIEAKRVMRESEETKLLSGLRLEVEGFLKIFGTYDREEGMEAFLQKREPKFSGK